MPEIKQYEFEMLDELKEASTVMEAVLIAEKVMRRLGACIFAKNFSSKIHSMV